MAKRLPKQVRDQIRRGEAAYAEQSPEAEDLSGDTSQTESTEEAAAQTEDDPPLPVGEAEPSSGGEETSPSASREGSAEEPQVTEAAQPNGAAPASSDDDWAQKYRVLQGKYNQEVPILHEQLRQSQNEIATLASELKELREKIDSPPPVNGGGAPLVTDADRQEFGEDLVDFVRRVAQDTYGSDVQTLKTTVGELGNTVSSVSGRQRDADTERAQTDRERAYTHLREHVPEWEELNVDPKFLSWLAQYDPLSGATRQSLLNGALEANDGPRIVEFFKRFKAEHVAVAPSPSPQPTEETAEPTPAVRMEDYAAPETGSGVGGAQQEKRYWRRAEITKFYNDCASGKYRKREKERRRLERDIIAAQTEGRIIDLPAA